MWSARCEYSKCMCFAIFSKQGVSVFEEKCLGNQKDVSLSLFFFYNEKHLKSVRRNCVISAWFVRREKDKLKFEMLDLFYLTQKNIHNLAQLN
jgi:hypothetical protein